MTENLPNFTYQFNICIVKLLNEVTIPITYWIHNCRLKFSNGGTNLLEKKQQLGKYLFSGGSHDYNNCLSM